jgi:hypothetical protein
MAFHMEAFRSSLSSGVTDVFQQVTYITAGALLAPSGSGLQVSAQLNKLFSIHGVGAHLELIQPQAASFQPLPYPTFGPNNVGTANESPPRFWDFSAAPKVMRPTEFLNIFASQTSAGAENEAVFVQFTDGQNPVAPPVAQAPGLNGNGSYTVVHGTATTTLTANAWSQVTPVLDTPLPAGNYALVGARVVSATALAFRMHPVNEPLWRPGSSACQAADGLDAPNARYINPLNGAMSKWGVWLTFFQNVFPFVDIWATAADTKEDFFFDLIKLSDTTSMGAL